MDIAGTISGWFLGSIFGNTTIIAAIVIISVAIFGRKLLTRNGLIALSAAVLIIAGGGILYRYVNTFKGPGFAFYEGNGASQSNVCNLSPETTDINLKNHDCTNDEIRSVRLLGLTSGATLRVYDSPDARTEDDWAEIVVKRDVDDLVVPTFEREIDNDLISLHYSANNGLDGKVSRIRIERSGELSSTIALYEGDNLTQNKVCEIPIEIPTSMNFKNDDECDNDEARSALLRNIPANTRIRLYDDPGGSKKDDWLDITVLRALPKLRIPSLQPSTDTISESHLIQFHRKNGLDGKVSRIEIDSGRPEPFVVFYEGNGGTQDIVCSLSAGSDRQGRARTLGCDNDEARSAVLYNFPAGRTVRVFDSPRGSQGDDWSEVHSRRYITKATVPGFSKNRESDDFVIHAHRHNGLDGKISYIEIDNRPPVSVIDLFEGNSGSQNRVCSIEVKTGTSLNFKNSWCTNDEARSMVLHRAPTGTVIRLFDNPSGKREDDWAEIEVIRQREILSIASFQRDIDSANLKVRYFRNNGLDGKVSRLEIHGAGSSTRLLSFYEGNNGSQNKVCDLTAKSSGKLNFKNSGQCDNDETRSVRLVNLKAGYRFSVYDDPGCGKGDDWAVITAKQDINSAIVPSYEQTTSNEQLSVTYHRKNGLDGKVSCVRFGQ